jgi:hypothetical protein
MQELEHEPEKEKRKKANALLEDDSLRQKRIPPSVFFF